MYPPPNILLNVLLTSASEAEELEPVPVDVGNVIPVPIVELEFFNFKVVF